MARTTMASHAEVAFSTVQPMRSDFTLSVIVPVYNERLTIRKLVERVRAVPIRKEIIIVDDGSTDGTADVVREHGRRRAGATR